MSGKKLEDSNGLRDDAFHYAKGVILWFLKNKEGRRDRKRKAGRQAGRQAFCLFCAGFAAVVSAAFFFSY